MRTKLFFLLALLCMATISMECKATKNKKPDVEFLGVHGEYSLFVDSLFGVVDGKRYWIDTESTGAPCIMLTAQEDFNGDGITDLLVTNVQACGGNAAGNAFFFVTYAGNGKFSISKSFGINVYDDPVIEQWQGRKAVVITEMEFDEDTEEVETHQERYVLVDTFALRAESPSKVYPMPTISLKEWEKMGEVEDTTEDVEITPQDSIRFAEYTVYNDLYSGGCSWYCGGEVQDITASSCWASGSKFKASNAHDFNHETVWAPKGDGIGESITYHFAGACPRVTTIKILNGDVKNEKTWSKCARAKMIKMYVNDKPYALLALEDSRSQQCFEIGTVGYHDVKAPAWSLRFEILSIYPGTKNKGVAISELNFNGIDVH